jgi:hypothetical protein
MTNQEYRIESLKNQITVSLDNLGNTVQEKLKLKFPDEPPPYFFESFEGRLKVADPQVETVEYVRFNMGLNDVDPQIPQHVCVTITRSNRTTFRVYLRAENLQEQLYEAVYNQYLRRVIPDQCSKQDNTLMSRRKSVYLGHFK